MAKLLVGADHAGLALKDGLVGHLRDAGHEVDDLGTHAPDSVDYPDFAHRVAEGVASGAAPIALLVCGSGVGMCISANKHRGVRAVVCSEPYSAQMARRHNDANVLCLGARVVGAGLATEILDAFMSASFEGGRHERRVGKIEPA